jgi:hypothetical protein
VLGDSDSHTVPWIDRLKRSGQLGPELVVPGDGHIGDPERIANYRVYLELARRRVDELRAAGELPEAEIFDRVSAEFLASFLTGGTRSGPGKRSKTSPGRPARYPFGHAEVASELNAPVLHRVNPRSAFSCDGNSLHRLPPSRQRCWSVCP